MPATMITLQGKYLTLKGDAATGSVSFTLSAPMLDSSGDVLYPTLRRVVDLDAAGAFSVSLPATKGDDGTSPTGLVYKIVERISPDVSHAYSIELDTANGDTQDLSDIAPATNVSVQTYALVSALNTHTAATTGVHGIADTAQLATTSDVTTAVAGKAGTAADESITGQWDFTSGRMTIPQVTGRPTTSPPDGTLAYDADARQLWVRSGSDWYTSPLTLAWLDGWSTSHPLTITNEGSESLINYQVKLSLTSADISFADAATDGADLRVTTSDGATLVDHYLASFDADSETATLWVKVPSLPTDGATLYLYYGNSDATDVGQTFDDFFAKFTTNSKSLALWHCDDGTGTSAADSSGNSKSLTLTNVTWGTGDGGGFDGTQTTFGSGHYLVFNGTNAYAQAPVGFFDTPPQQWTLEFWARPDATISGTIILAAKTSINATDFWNINIASTGVFTVSWKENNTAYSASSAALTWTTGTWYHIALTVGNGGKRLYRNGVLMAQDSSYAVMRSGSAQRFTLGANANPTSNFFHGAIDEVRVLNIESTPLEIVNDYQRAVRFTAASDQAAKFVRQGTVLSPVSGWETANGSVTAEPTVVYVDGTFHLFYHSGGTTAPTSGIGHATATDGITFTRTQSTPVLGAGGAGGESNAQHGQAFHDGTQFVMVYANTSEAANQGGGVCLAMSSDGDTWTPYAGNPVLPMVTGTWESTLGNVWMFQRDDGWHLLYSAKNPADNQWYTGLASAPAYTGPWTKYASNPLTVTGLGSPSVGGRPSLGHPSGPADTTPAWGWWSIGTPSLNGIQIIAGTSTDLINWVGSVAVMAPQDPATELAGVHDPYIIEANGKTYLYYSQAMSSSQTTGAAIYDGTLAELVTDLSAPAATLGPAQTR